MKLYKVLQGGSKFTLATDFLARMHALSNILSNTVTLAGIPEIYWYGVEGDFNVMVMELLG